MTKPANQQDFFDKFCSCNRCYQKGMARINNNLLDCDSTACPAHRRTNGMLLTKEQQCEFTGGQA